MSLADQPTTTLPPRARRLSAAEAYSQVVCQLQCAQLRTLRVTALTIAISLATAVLLALATLALLDYWLEWSAVARCAALCSLLLAKTAAFQYCWRKWVTNYSLERAAIDAEDEFHEFGQGLRTALDYQEAADRDFNSQPAAASPGLLSALHQETYEVSERAAWEDATPTRPLWLATLALLLVAGTCLIALAANSELRIAAGRVMLLPWQYTQVTFEPQQATVKQGESVVVKAEIIGRPIPTARLRFASKAKPADWTVVDLLLADGGDADVARIHGAVQTKLTNLQEDTVFEVLAGPVELPASNIRVLQPLTVKSFSARITPPAYTKKPTAVVESYDLKVWEGSQVELRFALNRTSARASLKRIAGPKDNSSSQELANIYDLADYNDQLAITLGELRESGVYELSAAAADDVALSPQRIKIQVTLDRKPSVKWVKPEEQWEVTPTTEVTMAIAAEDDLGVHKAGIAVQIGSGKLETLWETDAQGLEQSLAATAALLLEERGLSHKDSVTYHAFVEDNYFDKPRRTTTPLRFIDIRPYQQNFQMVEGGGCCNGSSVTLEELIKRQRDQLTQSFALQDQKLDKNTAKKLAAAQTELQDQTIEFAKGIAERGGNILPLDEAALQMGTAVNALGDADLIAAIPAQQEALAYLIMARENLRKRLSNSSSSSACRKFDREQKQKLRLPEQKKQEQQQQLAQAKKQLEDLAQKERKWSQQASQACQNPSSSSSGKPSEQPQSQQPQPSKEEVAKSQEELLKELAQLQEQIAQNELAGKTAQEQATRAREAMEQGQKELQQNKGEAASKQGENAADRLEQLAAHLAAMNQKDIGQRLNQAQKNAGELAAKQEKLAEEAGREPRGTGDEGKAEDGKPGKELGDKQEDLAQRAKMLAEVLEKLRQEAKGEKGPAGNMLEQIAAEQKPGEIAEGMQRTAEDLKAGKEKEGKAGAQQASEELSQLAQSLGAAKNQLSQPQLQELIKLEEQLAQLRAEGKKQGEQPGRAGTAEKWDQLQERLQQLAEADKRLEAALKKLGGNAQLKPGDKLRPSEFQQNSGNQETPPGHYSWDQLGDYKGLDEIAKALQTKIQEAILAGALQDADEPVPPEYKALVEQYYRTLSDDLR